MNSISVAFSVILALSTYAAAGDDESGWIIPDPDEITEAYQTGLIEYDDYQALVEIALYGCASATVMRSATWVASHTSRISSSSTVNSSPPKRATVCPSR